MEVCEHKSVIEDHLMHCRAGIKCNADEDGKYYCQDCNQRIVLEKRHWKQIIEAIENDPYIKFLLGDESQIRPDRASEKES